MKMEMLILITYREYFSKLLIDFRTNAHLLSNNLLNFDIDEFLLSTFKNFVDKWYECEK